MTKAGQTYLWVVICCGLTVVAHSVFSVLALWASPVKPQWFVLAGLTLLSGSFTVRIPGVPARLSVSETFVFAAVLLFGPGAATVIVVLDSLVISLWLRGQSRRGAKVLFNMAAPALAIWLSGHLFFALAGVPPLSQKEQPVLTLVPALFALALSYFLLNSFLIAGAVAFQQRAHMLAVWRENFLWISLNYFSGASVAALLLPFLVKSSETPFLRVIGVILPLLLISYLTFKTALGRVEDANLHLSELNRLYLSTIETLAMAIDAKDQITHGHIRRVQQYAIKLAKAVGVNDPKQLQAIEAAALLHDMGKLAVPEHILNKPGPLTAPEFERMKLHASVGADILSAIDFPYPVVPIVRHHHENWDGTGYPAGIGGTDIPIGARILSVVDCFDALTSDRPYRPRLADKDALRILQDRRGNMYDPLVVDAFVRLYPELANDQPLPSAQGSSLASLGSAIPDPEVSLTSKPLELIADTQSETLGLLQLGHELAKLKNASEMAEAIVRKVRLLVPASLISIYFVDDARQDVYAACVVGENEGLLMGMRIALGSRLTGWVAANKQSIRNSDALLDLGGAARSAVPRLRSCMAIPIVSDDKCVGVLTLYSAHPDAFSEEQQGLVMAVLQHSGPALGTAIKADLNFGDTKDTRRTSELRTDALLYIRVNFPRIEDSASPRTITDSLSELLLNEIGRSDSLIRPSAKELLVVLRGVTASAGTVAADRLREKIMQHVQETSSPSKVQVFVAPVLTTTPELTEESIIKLVRLRYAEGNDDGSPDRRVH